MTGSLLILKNEVKANAMMVPTTLGRGVCGHLRLVLAHVQYSSITGTAVYVRPMHLGPLNLTLGMTQYQITQAQDHHQEALQIFREIIAVEMALKQQIVGAIKAKYPKAVQSSITQQINCTIPDIFTYLFDTYGDDTPQALQTLQGNVKAMHFDPTEPVDNIFTEINDLADIADLAKDPITERQKYPLDILSYNVRTNFLHALASETINPMFKKLGPTSSLTAVKPKQIFVGLAA
eukprot:15334108-Ditylum_brightwellii.AAC.1